MGRLSSRRSSQAGVSNRAVARVPSRWPLGALALPALPGVLGVLAVNIPIAAGAERVDYTRQVKPLLARRCYSCHGALKQEAGLRLDTGNMVRRGGANGPVVMPGKSASSRLLIRVAAPEPPARMPPEGEALTSVELSLLRTWIEQGATSPAGERAQQDPRKHWAFQPVRVLPVPTVHRAPFPIRNPIDAFVAAAHRKHGLKAAPPAPKEVLLRRVYLDLTGLPPTREELHAFQSDASPDAYEKVVDRLLASPRYGERWGRHWMDVWRYSDWYGRRDQNDVRNSYGQIWRWRDWIVRSLNQDKGYDRMVQEMLAADEIAPDDDEALPATGFLVRNWYSLNYNQWMRDNVEHTGKAFLGLTLNCAHCHDHKYDPISQREYFAFRAFFEPLELRHDRVRGEPDPGPFKKYIYGASTTPLKTGMIRIFDEKLDAQTFRYAGGDERNRVEGETPVAPAAPAILAGDRLKVEPVELPAAAYYPGIKPFIREEEIARAEKALTAARALDPPDPPRVAAAKAELDSLRARIAADDARYGRAPGDPGRVEALARCASKAERTAAARVAEEQLSLAEKGLAAASPKAGAAPEGQAAVKAAGAKVTAARTAVESARKAAEGDDTKYTPFSPLYPVKSTGRRRALAHWIASRENPLTARVAVNHIWMRHFGRPLVDTVFDFGLNGKRPSHPELLDWLAGRFAGVQSPKPKGQSPSRPKAASASGLRTQDPGLAPGWSMKGLHRLIVTSSVYRISSRLPGQAGAGANDRIDRDNRYLWRFNARRVEAEVARDSILHAAGTLDLTMGGPELDNRAEDSRRRSMYYSVYAEDGGAMRFLTTFDAPDTCDCYRRSESIIPQQALAMTNSRLTLDQGRILARKLWETAAGEPDREAALIRAAFEQVLARRPTAAEASACREYLRKQSTLLQANTGQLKTAPAAGAVAPNADPRLRAAEGLVQALFSHHDFVTLR
jgi:hypothetical protein